MWFSNKICLIIVISLALVLSCGAQNSPQSYVETHYGNSPQSYLETHNGIRGRVNVGYMTWNNTLASYAKKYANSRKGDCNLVHSNGPYGENLAMGSSVGAKRGFSGVDAVLLWWKEQQYYNYSSNSCTAGKVCGHYTQMVWRSSTSLGCARTACSTGGWYVICSYYPAGNNAGQRPY